jgi:hypothetical protein
VADGVETVRDGAVLDPGAIALAELLPPLTAGVRLAAAAVDDPPDGETAAVEEMAAGAVEGDSGVGGRPAPGEHPPRLRTAASATAVRRAHRQ